MPGADATIAGMSSDKPADRTPIELRLTPEQMANVQAAADEAGLTLHRFLNEAVLDKAERRLLAKLGAIDAARAEEATH